jgi:hypothetical protein
MILATTVLEPETTAKPFCFDIFEKSPLNKENIYIGTTPNICDNN